MALSTLIEVLPNCTAINTYVLSGTNNYQVSIYTIVGSVETEIYRQVDLGNGATTISIADLTGEYNELYNTNPTLDATIKSITTFNGLFKIKILEYSGSTIVTTYNLYVVGTAIVDCCLANLIQDNLDCTCDTGDCCEDIKKAEKVFILIKGAILDASNADTAGALSKYNKAVELCGATPCDCNC